MFIAILKNASNIQIILTIQAFLVNSIFTYEGSFPFCFIFSDITQRKLKWVIYKNEMFTAINRILPDLWYFVFLSFFHPMSNFVLKMLLFCNTEIIRDTRKRIQWSSVKQDLLVPVISVQVSLAICPSVCPSVCLSISTNKGNFLCLNIFI